MERIVNTNRQTDNAATISFEKAATEFEKDVKRVDEASCALLLKNLLKTNLKLLKLNDIGSMLLF